MWKKMRSLFSSAANSHNGTRNYQRGPSQQKLLTVWDYENTPIKKTGSSFRDGVTNLVHSLKTATDLVPCITAFGDFTQMPSYQKVYLNQCGIGVQDVPRIGRDSADYTMITNFVERMLETNGFVSLAVISGDVDFAYPLYSLRERNVQVLLVVPEKINGFLASSGNRIIGFQDAVDGLPPKVYMPPDHAIIRQYNHATAEKDVRQEFINTLQCQVREMAKRELRLSSNNAYDAFMKYNNYPMDLKFLYGELSPEESIILFVKEHMSAELVCDVQGDGSALFYF